MSNNKSLPICGIRVDLVQICDVINMMDAWIINRSVGNYIVLSNSNGAVLSMNDLILKDAIAKSSLSVPDGASLILAARLYGQRLEKRVYGPDLLIEFLKSTHDKNYKHFFYGATEGTINRLTERLKQKFPYLKVSGTYAPPFRMLTKEEDSKVVELINNSGTDVLWVGLGCPKQEIWMCEHKDVLKIPVMVGIGAAFDFLSGMKPQAPLFMRENGLEWFFRLSTEPGRLWKRYLVNNSLFVYFTLKQFLLHNLNQTKRENV